MPTPPELCEYQVTVSVAQLAVKVAVVPAQIVTPLAVGRFRLGFTDNKIVPLKLEQAPDSQAT